MGVPPETVTLTEPVALPLQVILLEEELLVKGAEGSLTAEVNLFTANGQWIKKIALDKAGNLISQAVNVQDLPAGIYLLQIKAGQNSICKKVVVQ